MKQLTFSPCDRYQRAHDAPMFVLVLLLATLAPGDDIADQVVRCGVDRAQIGVANIADTPEGRVADIRISVPNSALTSDQLACLVGLAMAGHAFDFSDPAAQERFDPLRAASARKAAEIRSRQWLADRGLLDRLPAYDPAGQSLADFAVSLETLCGAAPGTTLKVTRDGVLRLAAPGSRNSEVEHAAFQCLFSAATAANPDPESYILVVLANREGH